MTDQGILDCQVFLRVFATELMGRYVHLSHFIEQVDNDTRGETPRLLSTYSRQLEKSLNDLLELYPALCTTPEDGVEAVDLVSAFEGLCSLADEFQSSHRKLRWFPAPWPDLDIYQYLHQTCSKPSLHEHFSQTNPTVVFSNLYDFLSSDVNRTNRPLGDATSLVVWALPKCEIANPLLWPILAHEVSHGIFSESDLSAITLGLDSFQWPSSLDDVARISWVSELNADLFAFRLLGPSYLFCLIYFAIFFHTSNLRSFVSPSSSRGAAVHPPPEVRIRLLDKLMSKLQVGSSVELRQIRESYEAFRRLYHARLLLDYDTNGISEIENQVALDDEHMDTLWNQISAFQYSVYPDLDLTPEELIASKRLSVALSKGHIASSVIEDARHTLLTQYIVQQFGKEGRTSDFVPFYDEKQKPSKEIERTDALNSLNAPAAPITEILNAGWLEKISCLHLDQPYFDWVKYYPLERSPWLVKAFPFDKLILEPARQLRKSIQVALVLTTIRSNSVQTPPPS